MSGSLDSLVFDARFTRELPAEPDETNRVRDVSGAAYSRVRPVRASAPKLVACSREVAALLGLDDEACRSERFARVFAGNEPLAGMDPYAHCYGGHQFGHWAGQLGDGRAINLGEVVGTDGAHWTLQLKGAGPTPYSRSADGFAVLRSSVREFLCSEAMHHLGVPTTRALSLVTTGDAVTRDMFYDGRLEDEPGAIVCRVARSFVRFGSFEIQAARRDETLLRALADFTLRHDYPELLSARGPHAAIAPGDYVAWFREVARRTAEMVVHWMRVGFVHGVMNTDNMSILGETIDYGPYGWLEGYDPGWTPNTTDAYGRRYRFGAQPEIAYWNLACLANAIVPLTGAVEPLREAIDEFPELYRGRWRATMAAKLGLRAFEPATDEPLLAELVEVLQLTETDMTIFFRALADDGDGITPALHEAYYAPEELAGDVRARIEGWFATYRERVRADGSSADERRARMHATNPKYVLRNWMAQLAIDAAAKGDPSVVAELLDLLRRPYDEQPERAKWFARRPEWARERPGCSMLSCSS